MGGDGLEEELCRRCVDIKNLLKLGTNYATAFLLDMRHVPHWTLIGRQEYTP
jgi:hypothetical protein